MELLWYLDSIREDKVKIESFLSGLQYNYRDGIEFSNPQTLKETIQMATHYYEHAKGRLEF